MHRITRTMRTLLLGSAAAAIFVTTTYGHWTKGEEPYIVSVRFKLSELDAKVP